MGAACAENILEALAPERTGGPPRSVRPEAAAAPDPRGAGARTRLKAVANGATARTPFAHPAVTFNWHGTEFTI